MDNDPIVEDRVPDADKIEIERVLEDGMNALADSLTGVDEETACLRPLGGSWSIVDCVEHIALTEAALLTRLEKAQPAETSQADAAREARFRDLAMNRGRRIDAPELVRPASQSTTLTQARDAVQAARTQTSAFVRDFPGDLRSWLTQHPLITRPVNCYEMLLLIALHPKRHALQITEIREQLWHARSQMK
jgi:uncharacterized damage-inducible protein DinB